jgi:hypothetical protein
MRSMVAIALAFVLAAAPALQGQQTAGLPIAEQPVAHSAEISHPPVIAAVAHPSAETVPIQREIDEESAAHQVSARNALTIIGAVVVVLALISFLR